MNISLDAIAKSTNGKMMNISESDAKELLIHSISVDSRTEQKGLFVPIIGDTFDGHDFIIDAIQKGAISFISSKKIDTKIPYVLVNDSNEALLDIATYYRSLFSMPVVGITGSVGKTSTKDAIASVLSEKYLTLKTQGNLNNTIGLPLTIFKLNDTYERAVIEMGINQKNEIDLLLPLVKPDMAVITNIEDIHIEYLDNKEGVLKEKIKIVDAMSSGHLLVNGDDPLLQKILTPPHIKKISFGLDKDAKLDYYVDAISYHPHSGVFFDVYEYGKPLGRFHSSLVGEHILYILLPAIIVGRLNDFDMATIQKGIDKIQLSAHRMDVITTDTFTIIGDYYNAALIDMKSAIQYLEHLQTDGRKICILGDMLELGLQSKAHHKELGNFLNKTFSIDLVITIGTETIETHNTLKKEKYHFQNKQDCLKALPDILQTKDIILLKASRGLAFEEIESFLVSQ